MKLRYYNTCFVLFSIPSLGFFQNTLYAKPRSEKIQIEIPNEQLPKGSWWGIRNKSINQSELFRIKYVDEETPILFRNIPIKKTLIPRAIITNDHEFEYNWIPRTPAIITLCDKEYKLEITGFNNDLSPDLKITLSHGNQRQIIWTIQEQKNPNNWNEPEFKILWAGDIDGDNNLDLVLNLSPKYSVRHYWLFLSSKAKKGSLLERVADAYRYAC